MTHIPLDHEPTRIIRIATIVSPDEFTSMTSPTSSMPALRQRALLFYAPSHVVGAFQAPGLTLSHRVAVHPMRDGQEQVMVMTIQRQGVVLQCILPLSDKAVQDFVNDCIERQSIQLVLALEDSSVFAVMEVDSPFGAEDRLRELFRTANPGPDGVQALVEMTKELLELPPAPPWVLELPVRHLVGVLAGRSVVSELSRARREHHPTELGSKVH
jgi:hypothetical protein